MYKSLTEVTSGRGKYNASIAYEIGGEDVLYTGEECKLRPFSKIHPDSWYYLEEICSTIEHNWCGRRLMTPQSPSMDRQHFFFLFVFSIPDRKYFSYIPIFLPSSRSLSVLLGICVCMIRRYQLTIDQLKKRRRKRKRKKNWGKEQWTPKPTYSDNPKLGTIIPKHRGHAPLDTRVCTMRREVWSAQGHGGTDNGTGWIWELGPDVWVSEAFCQWYCPSLHTGAQ